MKKYKLIKKFPGSGNVGDTYSIKKHIHETCYYPDSRDHMFGYSGKEVENNPEFWQEVVELDYEILEVECKWSSPSRSPGDVFKPIDGTGCNSYNEHCHVIKSIKRLSDNEVFTVGDDVLCGSQGNNRILSFEIASYGIRAIIDRRGNVENVGAKLGILKHDKKPLFVTEDGVEIFEGDEYWAVLQNNCLFPSSSFKINHIDKSEIKTTFSTKQAAQAYIDENKPKYSETDMILFKMWDSNKYWDGVVKSLNDWKGKNGKK